MSERERLLVPETVVDQINGRVPVIAGTTTDGLNLCVEYSRTARAAEASAVMVSPPRLPMDRGCASAFLIEVPTVVQDHPPILGYGMEPSLLARIAREIPTARTITLEDPPTL